MSLEHWQLVANTVISLMTLIILFYKQIKVNGGVKFLSEKVDNLSEILNSIWKKDILKSNIKNAIQSIATESLKNNVYLSQEYKDILMNWSDKIEGFSIDAYYTKYRGSKGVEDFLYARSNSIVSDLENNMLQSINSKINAGKKEHTIVDFLHTDSQVYQEIEILIRTLIKNGLKDETYISLFEEFTRTLMNEGTKAFLKWDRKPKIEYNGINN